jgi:hypothetical protein
MRTAALLLLLCATPAVAQLRTIPQEAPRGELRHLQAMSVELNGKPVQLSAGAQIRDADNRLVLPTSLTESTDVRYQLDGSGMIHRVWILSPQEKAQLQSR